MVSCDNGFVHYKGVRLDLMVELGCLMHSMIKDNVLTEDMLIELAHDACKSDEEVHEEVVNLQREEFRDALVQQIAELLSKGYDKEDIIQVIKSVKEKK